MSNPFSSRLFFSVALLLISMSASSASPTPVTFAAPTSISLPGIDRPRIVDLDGDGHLDIVAPTTAGFSVFYGKGDGTFTEVDYAIPLGSPMDFADFNGDNHLDIVTTYGSTVGIIYNTGPRTFASPVTVSTGTTISGLCAADFNGDNRPDIATGDNSTGHVGVLINLGGGSFSTPTYYNTGQFITNLAAAKLTSNGFIDIAVGMAYNPNASILLGDGTGSFQYSAAPCGGGGLACGDFTGTGFIDIAGCNYWSGQLGIAINNGNANFTQHLYQTDQYPSFIYAGDMNADGSLDLVVGHQGTGRFSLWLNDGTGNFAQQGEVQTTGNDVHDPAIGDLNEDGLPDVVVDGQNNVLNLYTNTTNPAPVVSYLSPASATVGGPAFTLTVHGAGFLKRTVIRWNGAVLATTYVGPTTLTASIGKSMLINSGAASVTVFTPAPGGGASNGVSFPIAYAPKITSFTPTSGPAGTVVTITGSYLNGASNVSFNGTPATFTVKSATSITAAVPAAVITGPISVTTPGGTVTSSTNFTAAPTITSFTPTLGPVGTAVVVTGTNFTGTTAVTFNGVPAATWSVVGPSTINATAPSGESSGPIAVTTPVGTATSTTSFTVVPAPTISSFTPGSGPAGTVVTITGTNFSTPISVNFNGAGASSETVLSSTSVSATVPSGASSGPISITTPGGTAVSSTNFNVTPPPSITSFTPSSGPVGVTVALTGIHFTGVTAVAFNGTAATSVTLQSDASLTAVVPAGATSGPISVTSPNGTAVSASPFTVTLYPSIPTGLTASPGNGQIFLTWNPSVAAQTYTVYRGTSSGNETTLAGSGITTTSFKVAALSNGATYYFKVAAVNASGTSPLSNEASATTNSTAPLATGYSPTSGPPGTLVTITGAFFTGVTGVLFNGTAASYAINSSTSIVAIVPAGATTGPIQISNPSGTVISTTSFKVTATGTPTLGSFSPTYGPAGTAVQINGTNLLNVTSVRFNGKIASYSSISPTQIVAVVPTGATTGPITINSLTGTATSATSFTVHAAPTITSFSPGSGAVGSIVIVNGTNFGGIAAVSLGGLEANYTVISPTQLALVVPAGAASGTIAVTSAAGTATSAASFSVTP